MVLAQVLYRIAVKEKTQKRYLLLGKRKALKLQLVWIRTLVEWLRSPEPLKPEQAKLLMIFILNHPEIFPVSDDQVVAALMDPHFQLCRQRAWKTEWTPVADKMFVILDRLEREISCPRALYNDVWIRSFMAFHNLPRVFWEDTGGLWEEPFPPIDAAYAIELAGP